MSDEIEFRQNLIERLATSIHLEDVDLSLLNEVLVTLQFMKDVVPDLMWELEATATFLKENDGRAQLKFINSLITRIKVATDLL